MARCHLLLLISAAVLLGSCSDTQRTTGPTESDDLSLQAGTKELRGYWTEVKDNQALLHSPLLCNFGGTGPECLRVFHSGQFVEDVFHRGLAQGTGCSRSVIRIAGIVRGRSPFRCHRRGVYLRFTWIVEEFHPYGTRIQVDWTGAGAASPTGFVYTNYR